MSTTKNITKRAIIKKLYDRLDQIREQQETAIHWKDANEARCGEYTALLNEEKFLEDLLMHPSMYI